MRFIVLLFVLASCTATQSQWRSCAGSIAGYVAAEKAVKCDFTAMEF